ncbi:hypothetical protein SAMN05421858_3022 [Haladaptatus litoreus]|uniref:Uncharacterized protein n=1 Tax=Haladaptatus litoreus TaxID=553468 RepID=A0A1N7CI57_9EURY|nr:hypothetical protein [Haladaptatus litoreus]SIR63301.1 hypothetical protein SAMN05421858_3022 [Haladaptatus litoreus]
MLDFVSLATNRPTELRTSRISPHITCRPPDVTENGAKYSSVCPMVDAETTSIADETRDLHVMIFDRLAENIT